MVDGGDWVTGSERGNLATTIVVDQIVRICVVTWGKRRNLVREGLVRVDRVAIEGVGRRRRVRTKSGVLGEEVVVCMVLERNEMGEREGRERRHTGSGKVWSRSGWGYMGW